METKEPAKQSLKWWQYILISAVLFVIGFGITNTYTDTSVMWDVGAGIQLVAWGFLITGIVKAVKRKKI